MNIASWFKPAATPRRVLRRLTAAPLPLAGSIKGRGRVAPRVRDLHASDEANFLHTMDSLLGRNIESGNRVDVLLNGDQIFPAMLDAIAGATSTITFETYIYWSGETGQAFADALSERARAGVRVHMLVDWVGSGRMDSSNLESMQEAGVEIRHFHPLRWYNLRRMNNRTHRKLLVVDGCVGFTGGVGIADQWRGHAEDPEHWRESHFRIQGPVVAQMQAIFMDNWMKVTGEVLHGSAYFPLLEPAGACDAQMFSSSPSGGSQHMRLMYLLAIAAAETTIHLASAYFIPDKPTRQALVDARARGVKVQIITPGINTDAATVRSASRALWGDLLHAGATIHEYQPTMYHCKVMIVDTRFVTVGSTNFDPRSFDLNDEASLNIYNREFAQAQERVFEQDLALTRQITLDSWRKRPLLQRMWERSASFLAPQL